MISSALVLAPVTHFFIIPELTSVQANKELKELLPFNNVITVKNTDLIEFKSSASMDELNINPSQKALVNENIPGITFTNTNKTSAKKVNLYVDMMNSTSRDLLFFNRKNLENMITTGDIELTIHFLPTNNIFSLYSAEALIETAHTQPEKTWDLMYDLAKQSLVNQTNKSNDSISLITKALQDNNITHVNKESIQNGTFITWLFSIKNDKNLQTGYYPPLLYVDNKIINTKTINLNDQEELRKLILQ